MASPAAAQIARHLVRPGAAKLGGANTTRRPRRSLLVPVATVSILLVVGGVGVILAHAQDGARQGLQDRFETRIDLTSRFVAAYDVDILAREASAGARRLGGQAPSQADFEGVVGDFGFEAAVLLDGAGRVIQLYPAKPALIGVDLTGKYAHLARAVAGEPAISNVVRSAVQDLPVIAFAQPFDTPYGRRVLSGAYDVSKTPLSTYLHYALPYASGEVKLVDQSGALVASNVPGDSSFASIADLDPGLGSAIVADRDGRYVRDGRSRWFTISPIAGSPLRIVASVPEDELYSPLAGAADWMPWAIILALGLGSLYTVRVLVALHRSRDDYRRLARMDSLTGVSNRRELTSQAERLLGEAHDDREPLAVLMVDLDHFKRINDTLGHEAGDEVLRVVTARMQSALRVDDLLGRWGGEEFVAVLPCTALEHALPVAERLRAAICGEPIALPEGRSTMVTASVGCAVTMDETVDELVGRADGMMYIAKMTGNAVVGSPETMAPGSRPSPARSQAPAAAAG